MKVNLTIPTSLSDIKLSQYQKFIRTTKDSKDDNFIARQLVGIFCNLPDEVVDKIKAKDFNDIVLSITKVLEQKPKFKDRFKLNGVKYGFIPNLEEITVGEKADLDTFLVDVKDLHKAMSVMYRPITAETKKGYLIEDYKADNKGIDASLDVAFGAHVFFSNLMNDLLSYIQNYIEDLAARNPKVSQHLAQNGDGITAFTNSHREIFSSLKKLEGLNYMRL